MLKVNTTEGFSSVVFLDDYWPFFNRARMSAADDLAAVGATETDAAGAAAGVDALPAGALELRRPLGR